ncbi:hypothetical protein SEUCBS140593_006094 [Sporothrix eucalyptigena]|uniref:Uncharacterized protein n=1 Tax=Sporothrix eucalyptigena TaxID=1812306 RepID=A0ABP0C2D1_9PEZI
MKEPAFFEKFKVMQYTKLPDHRPPLRRDKAVVIDLPGHPKRQIFPAVDRSFIFIPRALRPNQHRTRGGRTRSVMGSISGFSRRTSVYGGGGSYYNGSMYSPSIALSRRSSIAQDAGRDFIISPAGSVISRPPIAMENTARPVVRLPPSGGPPAQPGFPMVDGQGGPVQMAPAMVVPPMQPAEASAPSHQQHQQPDGTGTTAASNAQLSQHSPRRPTQPSTQAQQQSQPSQPSQPSQAPLSFQPVQPASQPSQSNLPPETSSLSTVPPPQHHPLPQKPAFQENRPSHNLPMHQPRPQKAVSVENIEAPAVIGAMQPPANQPYSMAFHQQVPIPMATGFPPTESHSRHPSYQSHTTGTPLSQIPERAIHAAPFQPNAPNQTQMVYPQQNSMGAPTGPTYYGSAPGGYVMQSAPQQGYFYPTPPNYPSTMVSSAGVPSFIPGGTPQGPGSSYGPPGQMDAGNGQHNMVAQEVNGMVYYVDASQVPSMPGYSSYSQAPMPQTGYMPGVGGMVTPAPADGYYYGGQPGMVYYQQ